MWNIKALAFTVQKLLARLKFQREWQNDRMTERTKTICPPIFKLVGIKNYVSLPFKCYIPNFVKVGPVVLAMKMLMHDGQEQMNNHSNRSPKWLRWPPYIWYSINLPVSSAILAAIFSANPILELSPVPTAVPPGMIMSTGQCNLQICDTTMIFSNILKYIIN